MKLNEIHLKGYKSIDGQNGQAIPLGDITVLLGANGSGKSNLVSFFKMLNFMTTGALQQYVGKQRVSRLLFYGPKETESISFSLGFKSDSAHDTYEVKLAHGLPDRLFIAENLAAFLKMLKEHVEYRKYYESEGRLFCDAAGTCLPEGDELL